jgi:hypothetical protein
VKSTRSILIVRIFGCHQPLLEDEILPDYFLPLISKLKNVILAKEYAPEASLYDGTGL